MLTHEQIVARRTSIGSSDVPKILGLQDAFGGAASVCLEKWGQGKPPEEAESDAMWLGNMLEKPLGRWFAERHQVELAEGPKRICPQNPLFVSNHDFLVLDRPEGVECKATHQRDGWGAQGTDEIPLGYWFQAQFQMLCADLRRVFVPAWVSRQRGEWCVERNDGAIAGMEARLVQFWEDYVLAGDLPEAGAGDLSVLKRLRRVPGKTVVIVPDVVLAWRASAQTLAEATKLAKSDAARVIAALGEKNEWAEIGDAGPAGTVSYKQQSGRKCSGCGKQGAPYRVLRHSKPKKEKKKRGTTD